jgi:hypothetical protein
MFLLNASFHCPIGAFDLAALLSPLFPEHRQQDNPPPRGDEVRYSDCMTASPEVEAQLPKFAAQLPR